MFSVGDKVFLKLRGNNLETTILEKKIKENENFYRIDWSKINFNSLLNQCWIVEKSLSFVDLQE